MAAQSKAEAIRPTTYSCTWPGSRPTVNRPVEGGAHEESDQETGEEVERDLRAFSTAVDRGDQFDHLGFGDAADFATAPFGFRQSADFDVTTFDQHRTGRAAFRAVEVEQVFIGGLHERVLPVDLGNSPPEAALHVARGRRLRLADFDGLDALSSELAHDGIDFRRGFFSFTWRWRVEDRFRCRRTRFAFWRGFRPEGRWVIRRRIVSDSLGRPESQHEEVARENDGQRQG